MPFAEDLNRPRLEAPFTGNFKSVFAEYGCVSVDIFDANVFVNFRENPVSVQEAK